MLLLDIYFGLTAPQKYCDDAKKSLGNTGSEKTKPNTINSFPRCNQRTDSSLHWPAIGLEGFLIA